MKTKLIFSALLVSLIACKSLKITPEQLREVTKKVESKDFTIVVNYANPLRMKPVFLTSEYDIRVKNDSAFAYLPYYGVAYSAPYNSTEGGIKFAEPMTDFKLIPHKKTDGWDIRFRVKSKEYLYDISMNIFNNGSSSVSVSSYQKDMISFNGEIKIP